MSNHNVVPVSHARASLSRKVTMIKSNQYSLNESILSVHELIFSIEL